MSLTLEQAVDALCADVAPLPQEAATLPEALGLWNGRFFTQYPLTLGTLDPAFSLPGGMCLVQSGLLAAGVVLLTAALHRHSPGE